MSEKQMLVEQMKVAKIIAIARGVDPKDIVDTAKALKQGGIQFLEVTFNQNDIDETKQSLQLLLNGQTGLNIGAGTVISRQQVEIAHNLGAGYIVTPNTDTQVIKAASEFGMAVVAGAFTPTEVVNAYNAGADYVKIFPAGLLGVPYIKALRGPLSHIPLFAVGGIDIDNTKEVFGAGVQGIGLGSNLVRNDLIKQHKYDEVTQIAREYVELVSQV